MAVEAFCKGDDSEFDEENKETIADLIKESEERGLEVKNYQPYMHEWTELLIEEDPKKLFAKLRVASLNLEHHYDDVTCHVTDDAKDLSARVKLNIDKEK